MCKGSLYDPDLAALAIKQARGAQLASTIAARLPRG
jgi:alpha-D-ribose 1-methylphosphonate 5-triphosphate synthase subunit PhnI